MTSPTQASLHVQIVVPKKGERLHEVSLLALRRPDALSPRSSALGKLKQNSFGNRRSL